MAMHHHHETKGPDLIDAARRTLEQAGEQWTPMRANVFQALAAFPNPASAYDVADALSKSEGRRVAANSIYRILDLFVTADLARRVESANAYIVNTHPGCMHDCIFLVCDHCGRTQHVDADTVTSTVRDVASDVGFQPERPVIEIRGTCAECRTAGRA